jgi:ATP-dependent RNA helicase SUPV3L1/SUV3
VLREVTEDTDYLNEARNRYIDKRNWLQYLSGFRRKLVKQPMDIFTDNHSFLEFCEKVDAMSQRMGTTDASQSLLNCKKFLFDIIIKNAEQELNEAIVAYKTLCITSDLRIPHEWYPYARLMKRKIIYHGGPTNSGKTYRAIQQLKAADPLKGGGMYCGPLRLLALEVYEQLNRNGVYTDLLTGQEQREVPFSTHISCTVEMVNINREYDVAVVDEIQMIANEQRGYAW